MYTQPLSSEVSPANRPRLEEEGLLRVSIRDGHLPAHRRGKFVYLRKTGRVANFDEGGHTQAKIGRWSLRTRARACAYRAAYGLVVAPTAAVRLHGPVLAALVRDGCGTTLSLRLWQRVARFVPLHTLVLGASLPWPAPLARRESPQLVAVHCANRHGRQAE